MPVHDFLISLANHQSGDKYTNPYRNDHALHNLRLYLEHVLSLDQKRILLVGEAPGHKGCAITGIPFTSGAAFRDHSHSMLVALRDGIRLPSIEAESTATIVWEYLSTKSVTPMFWNAFPFHPHESGNEMSNRRPDAEELKIGAEFLEAMIEMYAPETIASIGKTAFKRLKKLYPEREIKYIRHPSHGGKAEFVKGMNGVI